MKCHKEIKTTTNYSSNKGYLIFFVQSHSNKKTDGPLGLLNSLVNI